MTIFRCRWCERYNNVMLAEDKYAAHWQRKYNELERSWRGTEADLLELRQRREGTWPGTQPLTTEDVTTIQIVNPEERLP